MYLYFQNSILSTFKSKFGLFKELLMLAICTNDTAFWAKDESVRCCVALVWYKPYNSVFTATFCYYLYENVFENFIHCVCQDIRFQQNNVHMKSSSWTEKQLFTPLNSLWLEDFYVFQESEFCNYINTKLIGKIIEVLGNFRWFLFF